MSKQDEVMKYIGLYFDKNTEEKCHNFQCQYYCELSDQNCSYWEDNSECVHDPIINPKYVKSLESAYNAKCEQYEKRDADARRFITEVVELRQETNNQKECLRLGKSKNESLEEENTILREALEEYDKFVRECTNVREMIEDGVIVADVLKVEMLLEQLKGAKNE